MAWFVSLDRREISLILFCIIVFTLAYNLETSFQYLGVDPVSTQAVLSRFGLSRYNAVDNDGRKLASYRDKLERYETYWTAKESKICCHKVKYTGHGLGHRVTLLATVPNIVKTLVGVMVQCG